jgi:hypothetical protein
MTSCDVINPATEQVLRTVELLDVAAVDDAVPARSPRSAGGPGWPRPTGPPRCGPSPASSTPRLRTRGAGGRQLRTSDRAGEWEAGHVRDVLTYYAAAPERLAGSQIPVAGGLDVTFHEPLAWWASSPRGTSR